MISDVRESETIFRRCAKSVVIQMREPEFSIMLDLAP